MFNTSIQNAIELIGYWEGEVKASDLVDIFGITRATAYNYINDYISKTPNNLVHDKQQHRYVKTDYFKPQAKDISFEKYLDLLRVSVNENIYSLGLSELKQSFIYKLNTTQRFNNDEILRCLVKAIKHNLRLDVNYVSLVNPNEEGRVIAPHSLIYTNGRWHTRAWCEKSKQFKDFVISRFRGNPDFLGVNTHTKNLDIDWTLQVELIFEPDSRLSTAQKKVLEWDYRMKNGQLRVKTRACWVNYVLSEMQVKTKMIEAEAIAQQLVLVNKFDIKKWLFD